MKISVMITANNSNFPNQLSLDYHAADRILQVEIINLSWLFPAFLLSGMPYVGPAFDSALEDIGVRYPRLNVTQTYLYPPKLPAKKGPSSFEDWTLNVLPENIAAEYYFRARHKNYPEFDITVFIAAGLDDPLGAFSGLTLQADKVMMTSVSYNLLPGTVKWQPWLTTTIMSMPAFMRIYENLMLTFNWSHLVLLCDTNSNIFFRIFSALLYDGLRTSQRNHLSYITVDSTKSVDFSEILAQNVTPFARVLCYFGHAATFQAIMTAADNRNMTDGEYVFLVFLPFRHQSFGSFIWTTNRSELTNNSRNPYRTFLVIETIIQSDQNDDLLRQWRFMSRSKYNYTYRPDEMMTPHPSSSYAEMMAFAEVAEELRLNNNRFSDRPIIHGRDIFQRFLNRTFVSRIGSVRFNHVGERVPNMVLTQTDVDSGKITTVITQDAETGNLLFIVPIQWPNTWPVPDEPVCGYRGDAAICLLRDRRTTSTAYGAGISLSLLLVVAMIFYTRIRAQYAVLNDSWWVLHDDNLQAALSAKNPDKPKRLTLYAISAGIMHLKRISAAVTALPLHGQTSKHDDFA